MTPKPGIYERVPVKEYHSWDCASSHRIGGLTRTPMHARYEIDHPKQSEDFAFGEACHVCTLEHERFLAEYIKAPRFSGEGSRKAKAEFESANASKVVLASNEYERAMAMRDSVRRHVAASRLVQSGGLVEVSGVWVDEQTGIPCKMRADLISDAFSAIVDLKTTRNASEESFHKDAATFGYHRQAAFYLDGLAILGKPLKRFIFIAVEKEEPHAVSLYRLSERAIEKGRRENRTLLNQYAKCCKENAWPGYPAQVIEIDLPEWYYRQNGDME